MIKSGKVKHGETVSLGAGWMQRPDILVAPFSLITYNSAYFDDQFHSVGVTALNEVNPGEYEFVADVSLRNESSRGELVLSETSGTITADTWTSPSNTTAADTEEITIDSMVISKHGSGSNWNVRNLSVQIEYNNGGAWIQGQSANIVVATNGPVQVTITQNFPSADTWEFRLVFTTSDMAGATYGLPSYTYADELRPAVVSWGANNRIDYNLTSSNNVQEGIASAINFNGTLTGEIYKVEYIYDSGYSYTTQITSPAPAENNTVQFIVDMGYSPNPLDLSLRVSFFKFETSYKANENPNQTFGPQTFTRYLEENFGFPIITAGINISLGLLSQSEATATLLFRILRNLQAHIYYRTLVPTSTTVENNFTVQGYEYITQGSILSTGIGSYIATDGA